MWKSVGSPHRAWVFVTSTGTPRAAHTLLKLTPPAMTITRTSSGPISGTSITSSWIAVAGSPNRSGRTSWACIRAWDVADGRDLADVVQVLGHGANPSKRRSMRAPRLTACASRTWPAPSAILPPRACSWTWTGRWLPSRRDRSCRRSRRRPGPRFGASWRGTGSWPSCRGARPRRHRRSSASKA